MSRVYANGSPIEAAQLGALEDSTALRGKPGALAERFRGTGYVFVRGVIPPDIVAAARYELLGRLAEVGEVANPIEAGRWTGTSQREKVPDLGAWWRSVAEGPALRACSHGEHLAAFTREVMEMETLPQDFLYLRTGVRGTSTDLHYDYPFFARLTEKIITCWVALAEIPVELGPLAIIEGSNRFDDLVAQAKGIDPITENRRAAIDAPMAEFAGQRGARVLTADFSPGDVLAFDMVTCHGSLDNHDPQDRIRLSFDLRFQAADEPRDSRFFGSPPAGVTGKSYGELNGARPLGQKWHQR